MWRSGDGHWVGLFLRPCHQRTDRQRHWTLLGCVQHYAQAIIRPFEEISEMPSIWHHEKGISSKWLGSVWHPSTFRPRVGLSNLHHYIIEVEAAINTFTPLIQILLFLGPCSFVIDWITSKGIWIHRVIKICDQVTILPLKEYKGDDLLYIGVGISSLISARTYKVH